MKQLAIRVNNPTNLKYLENNYSGKKKWNNINQEKGGQLQIT